jgi:VWFA-related protein
VSSSSRTAAAVVAIAISLSAWLTAQPPAPAQTAQTPSQSAQTPDIPPSQVPPAQAPVFRAGVEVIQLDVSVLDGKRQPVRGLAASDFTVLEDGAPRPIRAFTAVDLPARNRPAEPVWAATTPPDIATNQVGEQDGRLVVILMDRSIPHEQPTVAARKIATAAIEALGPQDLGALVSTSGGVPQNLTADRTRLLKALNQRDWSTDSDAFPWNQNPEDVNSALGDGRCLCGLCVLETVTRVSDAVRDAPRKRKVLLFIGRGVVVQSGPHPPSSDVGCESRLKDARQKMFDSLSLSNLTVHSIDPIGLVTLGPQTRTTTHGAQGGPDTKGPTDRLKAQQDETKEILLNQGTLQVLPERTGGRTVLNTNAPEEKIPEIFRESEAYYLIGFEAGAPRQVDGRRSIEVRSGRTGVRVYTQRQYIVPAAQPASSAMPLPGNGRSPLGAALSGLLPAGGHPLALGVAAFASAQGAKAFVSIHVDAAAFAHAGDAPVPLELTVAAVDQTGRQVASARQTSTIGVPPTAVVGRSEAGIQTRLELDPEDYEIRVAVSDPARGTVASVFSQIAIPLFASAPLSLSDLVLGTRENTDPPAEATTPIPITPTTQRMFHADDRVWAFLQVYEGTQRTDALHPVSLRTTVVDAQGRTSYAQTQTIADAAFVNRRADYRITMPLEHLSPGTYLLRVEATGARQTAARTARFVVE